MRVAMTELLTTDEAAAHLRLPERKLYELVARAAVPCTKVTGRWLFSARCTRPLGDGGPDNTRGFGAPGSTADRRRQP
jgi:excisionase family DNA binding protein